MPYAVSPSASRASWNLPTNALGTEQSSSVMNTMSGIFRPSSAAAWQMFMAIVSGRVYSVPPEKKCDTNVLTFSIGVSPPGKSSCHCWPAEENPM